MIKNDINKIKNQIRNLIYQRSVDALVYSFGNDIDRYDSAIRSGHYKAFQISRDEFRNVDRMTTVNGRRMWLSRTVVDEMACAGELIKCDSYCAAPQNAFSKMYPVTTEKLIEISKTISPTVKAQPKPEWKPEDGFITEEEFRYSTADGQHITNDVYTEKEIKALERQCEQAKSYHRFCRKASDANSIRLARMTWDNNLSAWPVAYSKAVGEWRNKSGLGLGERQ